MRNKTNKSVGAGTGLVKTRPALDPRTPVLAQPYKRLVDEGFIIELNVKFTPTGVTVTGKPDKRMCDVSDSGLTIGTEYAVGMLSAVADKGNLIPKAGKKTTGKRESQPLPQKTLVPSDFDGTMAELQARANAVAQHSGGATLVGRVRSANMFDGTVTTSFSSWWANAKPAARAHALMQQKYIVPANKERIAKLGALSCPFRGTAEFTVSSPQDQVAHKEELPTHKEDPMEPMVSRSPPKAGSPKQGQSKTG